MRRDLLKRVASLVFLVSLVSGCSVGRITQEMALDALLPTNDFEILTKDATLSKENKVYVSLQLPKALMKNHSHWRNEYIPEALGAVGIKNYEVLGPEVQQVDPSAVEPGSYLLAVVVPHWELQSLKVKTRIRIPVRAAVYSLPHRKALVKAYGSAQDVGTSGWNIGKMVSSLLIAMLEEMYSS